jgi:hypothetical protein
MQCSALTLVRMRQRLLSQLLKCGQTFCKQVTGTGLAWLFSCREKRHTELFSCELTRYGPDSTRPGDLGSE